MSQTRHGFFRRSSISCRLANVLGSWRKTSSWGIPSFLGMLDLGSFLWWMSRDVLRPVYERLGDIVQARALRCLKWGWWLHQPFWLCNNSIPLWMMFESPFSLKGLKELELYFFFGRISVFCLWSLSSKSTPDRLAHAQPSLNRDGELLRAGRRPGHRRVPSKKRWRWRSWPSEESIFRRLMSWWNDSYTFSPGKNQVGLGFCIYHQQLGLV